MKFDLFHICSSPDCKFKVSDERLIKIISDLNKSKYQEPDRSDWE